MFSFHKLKAPSIFLNLSSFIFPLGKKRVFTLMKSSRKSPTNPPTQFSLSTDVRTNTTTQTFFPHLCWKLRLAFNMAEGKKTTMTGGAHYPCFSLNNSDDERSWVITAEIVRVRTVLLCSIEFIVQNQEKKSLFLWFSCDKKEDLKYPRKYSTVTGQQTKVLFKYLSKKNQVISKEKL